MTIILFIVKIKYVFKKLFGFSCSIAVFAVSRKTLKLTAAVLCVCVYYQVAKEVAKEV